MILGPDNVVEAVGNKVLELAGEKNRGIELILEKNMRIGTGMGSSASSSVAAALAVNDLLENPFERSSKEMLESVVHGEYVATKGSPHGDNVFASLLGGFIFITDFANLKYKRWDGGNHIYLVAASPKNLRVDTAQAREALKSTGFDIRGIVDLSCRYLQDRMADSRVLPASYVNGTSIVLKCPEDILAEYLTGGALVLGGIRYDLPNEFGHGVNMDRIVTPVRAKFITGYDGVKEAAMGAGAYGFSISGSGPAVFSVTNQRNANAVGEAMREAFNRHGVNAEIYVSQINNSGAQRI